MEGIEKTGEGFLIHRGMGMKFGVCGDLAGDIFPDGVSHSPGALFGDTRVAFHLE